MEIWEAKPTGTLWATPGLLQDSFTFTLLQFKINLTETDNSLYYKKLRGCIIEVWGFYGVAAKITAFRAMKPRSLVKC